MRFLPEKKTSAPRYNTPHVADANRTHRGQDERGGYVAHVVAGVAVDGIRPRCMPHVPPFGGQFTALRCVHPKRPGRA